MTSFQRLTGVAAAAALIAGGVTVGAAGDRDQADRQRQQRAIEIPRELIVELQKLAREAFGEDTMREMRLELAQALRGLSRDLGHFSVLEGPVFEAFDPQSREFRAEQTDRKTQTLAIGATGTLDLKNVVGDIVVKTGGGREATVEIVRVSRGRTDADARLGLERVTVDVVARGDRGSVSVNYPNERRPPYSVSVGYNVTVPGGTRLSVHSITGDVKITGVKGELTANTVSGALDIAQAGAVSVARTVTGKLTITDVQSDIAMEAGTMAGTVTLSNIKVRRLTLSAVSGEVSAREIHAGGADVNCMSGEIEYSGSIAPNGRYEFKSHSGEIRLGLSGSFDFEGRTFAGQIDADPSLGLTTATSRRQALRGSVGGGGAMVEATTFSGHIRLGRKLN